MVSENGNSNFSAADCATFSKVIVQIDFGVLNCDSSPKRKPEVDLQCCGRHLENGMTSCLGPGWSDLDQIWCADAELHADDDGNVKVETGSRISI